MVELKRATDSQIPARFSLQFYTRLPEHRNIHTDDGGEFVQPEKKVQPSIYGDNRLRRIYRKLSTSHSKLLYSSYRMIFLD